MPTDLYRPDYQNYRVFYNISSCSGGLFAVHSYTSAVEFSLPTPAPWITPASAKATLSVIPNLSNHFEPPVNSKFMNFRLPIFISELCLPAATHFHFPVCSSFTRQYNFAMYTPCIHTVYYSSSSISSFDACSSRNAQHSKQIGLSLVLTRSCFPHSWQSA
jgi:hypothetical protein